MAVTLPTYAENLAHPTWDQAVTAAVPQLMQGIIEFGKYAKPTAKLQWETKQYIEVDTDKRFRINWSYGGADVHYGTAGTMTFNTEVKTDTLSTMHASPAVIYGATSISDFDRKIYQNSMLDLVEDRTFRMNQGLTEAINYETWSRAGHSEEGTSSDIDIDSIITNGINSVKIKNKPAVSGRIASIPYLIRPHAYGHTIQGLSSTNSFWQSHVYVAKGAQVSGAPSALDANHADIASWVTNTASGDAESDILKQSQEGTTAVFPALSDIDFMLEQMQEGNAYQIVVAMPPAAYNYIARDFFGATLGKSTGDNPSEVLTGGARAVDTQNPLTDYGLNFTGSAFMHSGYDAIFYADPTLARLWPGAIWFFDLEALGMVCVNDFGPKLYPWHHLPNTTVDVMAKLMWCQRIVRDRKATGVLLNCKFR